MRRRLHVTLAVFLVLGAAGALFLVDAGADEPDPVAFDDTVPVGIASEDRDALDSDVRLPQAQVFYSGYHYVVGYYGIETLVDAHDDDRHERTFGQPRAIYVSDYAGLDLDISEEGYPVADGQPDWTDATDAHYVVDSEARTPAGQAAVPFSDHEAAMTFADAYGGEVVDWGTMSDRDVEREDVDALRDSIDDRHADADERVADAEVLLDREPAVVVGEDESTIQSAIDAAPGETTVVVPEGTYEEEIHVNSSVTIVGENATLSGYGNGTVVEVNADDVAITGLAIDGVGDDVQDEGHTVGDAWDDSVEAGYGHGDAGIAAADVERPYVADVRIDTDANGILLRDAPNAVIQNVHVVGADDWHDGFMGVMAMRSDAVVEHSTFENGRDGVYTHYAHETVVRENEFDGGRFGVHLMYTSDVVIADNEAHDQRLGGITVMTAPERIAIVGNDVWGGQNGIDTSGSDTYVADNVVVNNDMGIQAGSRNSIYERNVVVDNEIGIRSTTIHPLDRVSGNDFVGNDQHVVAALGGLKIWTVDGQGNYWEGAIGVAEGETLDRSYSPTDPVDGRLHQVGGASTLAHSPALSIVEEFRDAVPGLQTGSVVDDAPRAEPANPDRLDRVCNSTTS